MLNTMVDIIKIMECDLNIIGHYRYVLHIT